MTGLPPAGDELVRAAYGAVAAEYTNRLGSIEDTHELDRLAITRWAARIDGPVLDAGCGPGQWAGFLHRQGVDISGVDLVPEFIDSARSCFPHVPFRVASLRALDLADDSLAGALAWYSLIHLAPAELPQVLVELRRVLRPQGHLLVGFFPGKSGEVLGHAVTKAYHWSIGQMSLTLQEAGFAVLNVEKRHDCGSRPHAAIAAIAGPP
ncbi:ubiquinone/menaquinone biosynthesis C-methylase UbiE [Arthrobacter ulcerisalmonis]|uniref:class I SAM-dependent methyltransferase n=1 Tax=Arthrobacter sp. B1I2 TaxID=3042263 RepID=UPI00278B5E0F|nr:class I SAM-dependent methyltransferase [Arthrobacter sp. B1I2]MDQ0661589.1 ubiquinone/menaquinone biosynthesis C-methylase UbiE [Arthrobacter ulcerisalmonis]MDQ0729500.1 ubiquinone/menaquinone biosynthesis C-methylase UbiE [Arthrobacter sp. B1I2]